MTAAVVHLTPRVLAEQVRWIGQIEDDDRARRLGCVVVEGIVRLLRRGAIHEEAALVSLLPIVLRFITESWMSEVIEMMLSIPSVALRREARRRLGGPVSPAQTDLLVRLAGADDSGVRARR